MPYLASASSPRLLEVGREPRSLLPCRRRFAPCRCSGLRRVPASSTSRCGCRPELRRFRRHTKEAFLGLSRSAGNGDPREEGERGGKALTTSYYPVVSVEDPSKGRIREGGGPGYGMRRSSEPPVPTRTSGKSGGGEKRYNSLFRAGLRYANRRTGSCLHGVKVVSRAR